MGPPASSLFYTGWLTNNTNLKVDRVISWKFDCAACGANCSTTIPVVKQDVNFKMPDCPISATTVAQTLFNETLPTESPTKGVSVTATGTVSLTDASADTVVSLSLDATVQ